MKRWFGFLAFFVGFSLVVSDLAPAGVKLPQESSCACVSGCGDVCCCAEKAPQPGIWSCAPADHPLCLANDIGKEFSFSAQPIEISFHWELFSLSEALKPDNPFSSLKPPPPRCFS